MSEEKKKKTIEPGTHQTKVKNYGLRETEAGNMQIFIGFTNGVTYFQNVGNNEDGDKYASEALASCGFKGKDLIDLYEKDALDKDVDVQIFVKYTPNAETGKEQMNVYVNSPSKQMKGKLDKSDPVKLLKSLKINLKKDLKTAQSEISPVKAEKKVETKEVESEAEEEDDSDIPF